MDVVHLLHRSVYVLVFTRPFGAAVIAGMKLLQELGTGQASTVMLVAYRFLILGTWAKRTWRKALRRFSGTSGA